MNTQSIAASQQFLAAEKRSEQWALTVLHSATFTDCLKVNGIAPILEVLTPEGKTVTIRGSDIYDRKTWKKFLVSTEQSEDIYQLTEVGEHLATQYKAWLLKSYTPRYQVISTEDDLAWLERVVTLAVMRHIMEQKYAAYTTQGLETFADPHTAIEMGNLLLLNSMMKETARLIHHIVKEPDQAQHLLQQFSGELYQRLQGALLPTRESLPSLPSGNPLSSTPELAEGESHE